MAETGNDRNTKKTNPAAVLAVRWGIRLIMLLFLVLIIQLIISSGYDFGYNLFAAPAMSSTPGREVAFTVKKGESTSKIINDLADAGLIRDKLSFRCQIIFYDKVMQPGEYTLNTSMTSKEILMMLNDGPGGSEEE